MKTWRKEAFRWQRRKEKLFRLSSISTLILISQLVASYLNLCPLIFRFGDDHTPVVHTFCHRVDVDVGGDFDKLLTPISHRRSFWINRSRFSEEFGIVFMLRTHFVKSRAMSEAFVSVHFKFLRCCVF